MVQWKGEITREESGRKAELLDSVEHFSVPNFFVVTRSEIEEYVSGQRDQRQLLNSELTSELSETLEDAYREIGMSSEVREATGKARNLVGGQRENQLVSIRISGSESGSTKFRLNIGSSKLEEAFREVLASYYREDRDDSPAVIVQKMIEPEHSGAVIPTYLDSYTLIETVQGLGVGLERGIVTPSRYLIDSGEVDEVRTPESQIKITKHPMNGGNKRRKVMIDSAPFSNSQVKELEGKVEDEEKGLKFAYKRGTFYVVDAFSTGSANPFSDSSTSLNGIRVSKGEISGELGKEVSLRDETAPPQSYRNSLIARKGGFTSTDAQKARRAEKPAIFSYSGEAEEGEDIRASGKSVELERDTFGRMDKEVSNGEEVEGAVGGVTALEIVAFSEYMPEVQPITEFRGFFEFDGGRAVVDARRMDKEPLESALQYIEFQEGVLVLSDMEEIALAVEHGFSSVVVPDDREEEFKIEAERQERKFILDRLRDLDSS